MNDKRVMIIDAQGKRCEIRICRPRPLLARVVGLALLLLYCLALVYCVAFVSEYTRQTTRAYLQRKQETN